MRPTEGCNFMLPVWTNFCKYVRNAQQRTRKLVFLDYSALLDGAHTVVSYMQLNLKPFFSARRDWGIFFFSAPTTRGPTLGGKLSQPGSGLQLKTKCEWKQNCGLWCKDRWSLPTAPSPAEKTKKRHGTKTERPHSDHSQKITVVIPPKDTAKL